ncbi:MAG TPA: hypothetical protein VN999_14670 [Thermoanaerobaculia bacterium]|nr:hypothetical protein [Thermoanaerobaculia bacterium]
MSVLARPKQEQVISLLVECCSIRAIERITGVHRDTVMRLGLRAGRHAYLAMDRVLRDIQAERIECDELWTYVAKKDKRLTVEDKLNDEIGSQFVFIGMDPATKLVPSFEVGKRNIATAHAFM